MVRRRFLAGALVLACLPGYAGVTTPGLKPLVLVFASGQEGSKGVAAGDVLTPLERNMAAARAVRERLDDSNAVTGTLFSPEAPLFLRAAQEANVKLDGKRGELSQNERTAIAKAAGAVYCVVVSLHPLGVEANAWEMSILGIDARNGKTYSDKIGYTAIGGGVLPPPDPNALSNPQAEVSAKGGQLISAANTLVLRLLGGPLGDYGRVVPPDGSLPPAVTPPNLTAPLRPDSEENIQAATEESRQLLEQGDANGAITLLRRTVNRAPLLFPPRLLLARAYLAANRLSDAANEVRRALQLVAPEEEANQREVTKLLADACAAGGDINIARAAYEPIIAAQPDSPTVNWARLAFAELLAARSNGKAAADQFRAVLRTDRGNRAAAVGLARLLAEDGDFVNAIAEIAPQSPDGTPASKMARHAAAVILFEVAGPELARLLNANRIAWEGKQISREVFYRAAKTQAGRAAALMTMVKSAPPEVPAGDPAAKAHNRRVLAASLLTQAFTALQTYLETGNEDANAQSSLCLLEFQREFKALTPP